MKNDLVLKTKSFFISSQERGCGEKGAPEAVEPRLKNFLAGKYLYPFYIHPSDLLVYGNAYAIAVITFV